MVRNRKGLAPWSLAREAGIESATVDGTIEVPQYVQPILDTGFVNEKGDWKGVKSSDENFIAYQIDLAVGNGATIVAPSVNEDGTWPLDMTGFKDIFIAIKPTNGGNYAYKAVMASGGLRFANIEPVNAAATLRGLTDPRSNNCDELFNDTAEALTADVWNIFVIGWERLANQKLLMFSITNNSGGNSDIETCYLRMV